MAHPAVLLCAAHTLEAARTSAQLDTHLAKSRRYFREQIAATRKAIAYSQYLLSDLKNRRKKIGP